METAKQVSCILFGLCHQGFPSPLLNLTYFLNWKKKKQKQNQKPTNLTFNVKRAKLYLPPTI